MPSLAVPGAGGRCKRMKVLRCRLFPSRAANWLLINGAPVPAGGHTWTHNPRGAGRGRGRRSPAGMELPRRLPTLLKPGERCHVHPALQPWPRHRHPMGISPCAHGQPGKSPVATKIPFFPGQMERFKVMGITSHRQPGQGASPLPSPGRRNRRQRCPGSLALRPARPAGPPPHRRWDARPPCARSRGREEVSYCKQLSPGGMAWVPRRVAGSRRSPGRSPPPRSPQPSFPRSPSPT